MHIFCNLHNICYTSKCVKLFFPMPTILKLYMFVYTNVYVLDIVVSKEQQYLTCPVRRMWVIRKECS